MKDQTETVLAALVPDDVIFNIDDFSKRYNDGVVLFVDITGFTDLCEKYNAPGEGGPSRLTPLLNTYLGGLIQEIMVQNGDVLKFAGDAFLATWKKTKYDTMMDIVHKAINSALEFRRSYGSFKTDVGIAIKAKIAIAAGPIVFSLVGNKENAYFIVVGQAVWDCTAAEHITEAGEIIVSKTAWKYVKTNDYLAEDTADGQHVKILDIGPDWRKTVPTYARMQSESVLILGGDDFLLRPAVSTAKKNKLSKKIRKFIMTPVLKSIETDQFEYLTETRQVTLCLINIYTVPMENDDFIDFVNHCYGIVCMYAGEKLGCVNKVSLFDKGLLFIVIFGLRGFKHILENKFALRYAHYVYTKIYATAREKTSSVSIGVTAGKTYCGVFGHTLRREYTVIGSAVNKSARIMVAYNNKITCDRAIFINSRMSSKYFKLQEEKPLKGIAHPGPIYEFRLIKDEIIEEKMKKLPILGRDIELQLFLIHLNNFLYHDAKITMLIYEGDSGEGKTRLITEIILRIPKKMTIRRNNVISSISLPIYRICLTISDGRMPHQTIGLIMLHFKTYIHSCLLIIDNIEYMDSESWIVLKTLMSTGNIFVVATKSNHINLGKKNFEDPKILNYSLKKLNESLYAALACQFLTVFGIEEDILKVIEKNSNGSIAWMENYLVSAVDAGELSVIKASLKDIRNLDIICPDLKMLMRPTASDIHTPYNYIKAITKSQFDLLTEKYVEYFQSEFEEKNYLMATSFDSLTSLSTVFICIKGYNFKSTVIPEQSTDVAVIQTFDSLTPFEQLLLKCASTLGTNCSRKMLCYVMDSNNLENVALAVKRMFDIGLLKCASPIEKSKNGLDEKCYCTFVETNINLPIQLPRYAFCENMQFTTETYRETTYNLLTDLQTKKFHNKAFQYLAYKTPKCLSCGGVYFVRMLETNMTLRKRPQRRGIRSHSISTFRSYYSDGSGSDTSSHNLEYSATIGSKGNFTLGFVMINRMKKRGVKVAPFASFEFTDCTCHFILAKTYEQMVHHCMKSVNYDLALKAMLKHARICMSFNNNLPQALKSCNDALKVVNEKSRDISPSQWKVSSTRGRIYTLFGYAYMKMGELNKGSNYLFMALKEFGCTFPKYKLTKKIKIKKLRIIRYFRFYVLPSRTSKRIQVTIVEYYNNLSDCLRILCDYFIEKSQWMEAKLAAFWSLSAALEYEINFPILCSAYANLIKLMDKFRETKFCQILEMFSLRICHEKSNNLEVEELHSVSNLYGVIFFIRLHRGDISTASVVGQIGLKFIQNSAPIPINMEIIPSLVHCLLMGYDISDTVQVLKKLKVLCSIHRKRSQYCWYYALCLSFTLETGLVVEHPTTCITSHTSENLLFYEHEPKQRLYSVLWLWYVRKGQMEEALQYKNKYIDLIYRTDNFANNMSCLYYLEGLIIFFVYSINRFEDDNYRKTKDLVYLECDIEGLISTLYKAAKYMEVLMPRLLHLKAYYKYSKNLKYFHILQQAEKLTVKHLNILQNEWITHSMNAWSNRLTDEELKFWDNYITNDNYVQRGLQIKGHYTLRGPKYPYNNNNNN